MTKPKKASVPPPPVPPQPLPPTLPTTQAAPPAIAAPAMAPLDSTRGRRRRRSYSRSRSRTRSRRRHRSHSRSSSEDNNRYSSTCEELKHDKGVKDDIRKLFIFSRSYMYNHQGCAWGLGPDSDQRRLHRLFIKDPRKYLQDSSADCTELRARLAILEKEPLFATSTQNLAYDAEDQLQLIHDDNYQLPPPKAPLDNPLNREVFAELTALFLFYELTQTYNRTAKRNITDTVGLLRHNKASILSMSLAEFNKFQGYSFVSYLWSFLPKPGTSTLVPTHHNNPVVNHTPTTHEVKRTRVETFFPPRGTVETLIPPHHTPTNRTQWVTTPTLPNSGKVPLHITGMPPPKPIAWVVTRRAAHLKCNTCKGNGHVTNSCVSATPPDNSKRCYCCNGTGHYSSNCPSDKQPKR